MWRVFMDGNWVEAESDAAVLEWLWADKVDAATPVAHFSWTEAYSLGDVPVFRRALDQWYSKPKEQVFPQSELGRTQPKPTTAPPPPSSTRPTDLPMAVPAARPIEPVQPTSPPREERQLLNIRINQWRLIVAVIAAIGAIGAHLRWLNGLPSLATWHSWFALAGFLGAGVVVLFKGREGPPPRRIAVVVSALALAAMLPVVELAIGLWWSVGRDNPWIREMFHETFGLGAGTYFCLAAGIGIPTALFVVVPRFGVPGAWVPRKRDGIAAGLIFVASIVVVAFNGLRLESALGGSLGMDQKKSVHDEDDDQPRKRDDSDSFAEREKKAAKARDAKLQ